MAVCYKQCHRFWTKPKTTVCILVVVILTLNVLSFFQEALFVNKRKEPNKYSFKLLYNVDANVEHFYNKSSMLQTGFSETEYGSTRSEVRKMLITLEDFREGRETGNPLIDRYGSNDIKQAGELGRGIMLSVDDDENAKKAISEYKVNTIVSDNIPLNRLVPDSRISGCDTLTYNHSTLPSASIIIPFHNEWPSLLLRTVYSIVNRSPRRLVKEIILVDDASTLDSLKQPLDEYISANFPEGLILLIRMPERSGLIASRMHGCREATGDVLIFFDSHMEVNIDWLPPLLTEIARDRTVVAMATLDYIQSSTFQYKYNVDYLTRYGWNWRLAFFETFFRNDQFGPQKTSPRPGATMVGAAFAIEKAFFYELGGYDEGMKVWGGENLEMSWRVWLCGGRLLHVPCSRIGHVPRGQPYSFPGGRRIIEHFNYKRAISVWMGDYSRFVYHTYPDMLEIDIGDISSRLAIKSKLQCKDFSWYLKNVWPELNVPDENTTIWGEVVNEGIDVCLDNDDHLFPYEQQLHVKTCFNRFSSQAFSMTTDNLLRTSLQCVVAHNAVVGTQAQLEDCLVGTRDKWKYLENYSLVHVTSGLCLDADMSRPFLEKCQDSIKSQKWKFRPYTFSHRN